MPAVRSPRNGRLVKVPNWFHPELFRGIKAPGVFIGDFEILYYDTGTRPLDPFSDLAAYCREMDLAKAKQEREERERKARQAMARRLAAEREIHQRRRRWLQGVRRDRRCAARGYSDPVRGQQRGGNCCPLAAFGVLCVCGWKLLQTFTEKREARKPPRKAITPLAFNPKFLKEIEKIRKDQAAKTPLEKPQLPAPFGLESAPAFDFMKALRAHREKPLFPVITPEQLEALKKQVFEDDSKDGNTK